MHNVTTTVSVIVPVYNGSRHIQSLLDCMRAQTFKDFEVLFVNDGSTDETAEKLEQLSRCFSSFPISIIHQKNAGVSAARNCGLNKAKGTYVCFVDVDDKISPDYLELLVKAVRSTEKNVAMGYITREYADLQVRADVSPVVMGKTEFLREFLYRGIRFSICAGIYSRECLEQHQLKFPVGYRYSEDVYLLWQLFAQEEVTVLPCAIYFYYDNPMSVMNCKMNLDRLQAIELMKKLESFMVENAPEFSDEFCRYAVARHHWSILWQAASRLGSYTEFQEYCSHFNMNLELKKLYSYPQKRISWSSRLFCASPWLYYHILRGYMQLTNRKK